MSRVPILIVLVVVVGLVVLVSSNSKGDGLQVGGGSADDQPLTQKEKQSQRKNQANSGDESAAAAGGAQQKQQTATKPTTGCGDRVLGPEATGVEPPPVPSVKASRLGQNARVNVRFLATPAECRPAVVDVRITPLGDPTGAAGAGLAQVEGSQGSVMVRLPQRTNPPYQVRVIALTATGAPSAPLLFKLP